MTFNGHRAFYFIGKLANFCFDGRKKNKQFFKPLAWLRKRQSNPPQLNTTNCSEVSNPVVEAADSWKMKNNKTHFGDHHLTVINGSKSQQIHKMREISKISKLHLK